MHWVSVKDECHPSSLVTHEAEYAFPIQTILSGAIRSSFASIRSSGENSALF